ncbi:hypothetical protein [Burkholderia sp. Ac-20353]|uniref:hypothetical protein n=1 Tax=Burkholderia sp. Ac-20353 TaxID=2703894 RepID=UPI00197B9668|nr:hypothetical protein [Burkholderia sp. Ac-20353]MBN3789964.1 hypothetical protein [Burkholderia sp. Ac-20353]
MDGSSVKVVCVGQTDAYLIHANATRPHGLGSRGIAIVARAHSADVRIGLPDCAAGVRMAAGISGVCGRKESRNLANA